MQNRTHCGHVAIIGRPNVGKSTLLNRLLGRKISITSHKPQTTRHRILGIKTQKNVQAIYVDTPGMHTETKRALNRLMNRTAKATVCDVDIIIFMVDARRWTDEDEFILNELRSIACPVVLVLNKVDLMQDKKQLLPMIDVLSKKFDFAEIIPLSVRKGTHLDVLEKFVWSHLPEGAHLFSQDQVTDQTDQFLIAEIIREKIMRFAHQEVPYSVAVTVESMKIESQVLHIDAIIWAERPGQKVIIVGKKGEKLREIGSLARHDLERLFNCKVFLSLWVKVKENWTGNENMLSSLGMMHE
jgi:GTP-binding protein Era